MHWLNYHHLLYFWMMAREGSVSRAAEKLHLSQPTISGQLRQLEKAVGTKLYERVGRELRLTDTGRLVFDYADEIFSTGQELMQRLRGGTGGRRLPFVIGIPDYLPKLVVYRLMKPVFELPEQPHVVCREGKVEDLLADLALHRIDVVLSDSQVGSQVGVKAFNHLLGQSGVSWAATTELCEKLRPGFPESIDSAPVLLPTQNTVLRRSIEQWFLDHDFAPQILAEIEDGALMKVFASEGLGVAPIINVVLEDARNQYGLHAIGEMDGVETQFFAISVERKVTHPALVAMVEAARERIFIST